MTHSRALAALAATGLVAAVMVGAPAAQDSSTEVFGSTNIWLAGETESPSIGQGTVPPSIRLPDGATAFTVSRVTVAIGCCGGDPSSPPDGGDGQTSITPDSGSIGPYAGSSQVPLVGVFLRGGAPSGTRPPELGSDDDGDFRSLSPALKQPFFIGDGKRPGGAGQTFRLPDGAQRLFVGIADGFGFTGPPGSYQDNRGSFDVTIRFGGAAPALGETANAKAVNGEVLVGIPSRGARASQKGVRFVPLEEARSIPIGSFLDTTKGTVALTTARNRAGKTQSGRFSAGLFQVLQSRKRSARGLTELQLKGSTAGFKSCGSGGARAALSRRTVRRLRANARGRYRTRGRHSAATVRGTTWTVADRCDGTLTSVKRGEVAVRDFRLKKTIVLTVGKSYLAAR
ncbi:MAG: hypothetical protein ACRDJY_01260 [Thermoleophilaceae bacterium]